MPYVNVPYSNVTSHDFEPSIITQRPEEHDNYDTLTQHSDNFLINQALDNVIINPLLNGDAYSVEITEFKDFASSSYADKYELFGLDRMYKNGYISEYNIDYRPFLIGFKFHYNEKFINNAKNLFSKLSSSRYCSNIKSIKDMRELSMACALFGDFDLSYIEKEGWFGIKNLYLDSYMSLHAESAALLANKIKKIFSYLCFSFVDSANKHILGVYSDFRDYSLSFYNTQMPRRTSKIISNSPHKTFFIYQVEPLSAIAMSYRLRTFFLIRERDIENHYAFIIYLNDDEVSKISNVKSWAYAEKYSALFKEKVTL